MKTTTAAAGTMAIGLSAFGIWMMTGEGFETKYRYERVVREAYVRALERDPGYGYEADPGAKSYEDALAAFYEGVGTSPRPLGASAVFDDLVGSEEYREKNPNPEPPPCVELPECANTGGTWDSSACACSCPDGSHFQEDRGCVEDLPPPEGPDPADYLNMDRVEAIINGSAGQQSLLAGMTWAGWRDPLNVASNCPDDVEYIGFDNAQELEDFGNTGLGLTREGEDFMIPQMRKVNRRCRETHPQHRPAFCGRSEMTKTRLAEYRVRLDPHKERSNVMRVLAGRCTATLRANGGYAYDSIAGWCGSLRTANETTGFTADECPQ